MAVPEGRAILCQSIPAALARYCIKGAKFDETNWNRHTSPSGLHPRRTNGPLSICSTRSSRLRLPLCMQSSKLHIEFLHLIRLVHGSLDPFGHMRHRHDGPAISGAHRVELYAIGEEAGANRCVHGIGKAWLCTKQVRSLGRCEAVAPDRHDAVDIGLGAGKDFE